MPHIVQFAHPGPEHEPDSKNKDHKSWNTGAHCRKFLVSPGDCVQRNGHLKTNVDLLFWGEWEPPSDVTPLTSRPDDLHPRWLHTPYLPAKIPTGGGSGCSITCKKGGNLQNTDPYLFENAFKYLICKQGTAKNTRRTRLAKLDPGSLILFGSTKGTGTDAFFQLDTVFVVADFISYDPAKIQSLLRNSHVSAHYKDVVIRKAFSGECHTEVKFRLYSGATFENQIHGMYSYAPAQRSSNNPQQGFKRVALRAEDFPAELRSELGQPFLTSKKLRNFKITPAKIGLIKEFWEAVRSMSRKQKCVEGVRFPTPATRPD